MGKIAKSQWKHNLGENGKFISIATGLIKASSKDLNYLMDLTSKGILTPITDKVYSLEYINSAYDYVQTGRKRGNIVIKIA